jgi:hypothetical protein
VGQSGRRDPRENRAFRAFLAQILQFLALLAHLAQMVSKASKVCRAMMARRGRRAIPEHRGSKVFRVPRVLIQLCLGHKGIRGFREFKDRPGQTLQFRVPRVIQAIKVSREFRVSKEFRAMLVRRVLPAFLTMP